MKLFYENFEEIVRKLCGHFEGILWRNLEEIPGKLNEIPNNLGEILKKCEHPTIFGKFVNTLNHF